MSDRIDKLGMVRLSDQLPGLKKAKLAGCGHRKAADSGRVDNDREGVAKRVQRRLADYCLTPMASIASLPLDSGGRLAGDVVDDAVDAAHFIDDAAGHLGQQRMR